MQIIALDSLLSYITAENTFFIRPVYGLEVNKWLRIVCISSLI